MALQLPTVHFGTLIQQIVVRIRSPHLNFHYVPLLMTMILASGCVLECQQEGECQCDGACNCKLGTGGLDCSGHVGCDGKVRYENDGPSPVVDECNVCGGNGTSCLG